MAEASDAVAEVTPEAPAAAPVVEVPAAEAPATETPAAEAPDYGWIEEFGGADAVREAAQWRQHIGTEDGAIDTFVETGVALGLTPAQLAALFPEEAAQAEAEEAAQAAAADQPMTRAEIEELLNQRVLEPLQQQQQEQQTEIARGAVRASLDALNVPEEVRYQVLGFADAHIDTANGDAFDPVKIQAAIEQGVKDFDAFIDAQVQRRIAAKEEVNSTLPKPVSGGATGGGEEQGEPMSLAEAKARVRAQFGGK